MYFKQTFTAGMRIEIGGYGRFVRVLESDFQQDVKIQFYQTGKLIAEAERVGRGYAERMEDGHFDKIAITSTSAQTIALITRENSSVDYQTPPVGDVNVLNFPANQQVTLSNPYFQYGASFKSTSMIAANTAEEVFSPAANVNGAVIWAAQATGRGASSTERNFAFVAKSSAPSAVTDGDVVLLAESKFVEFGGLGFYCQYAQLIRPVYVPAGRGLYSIASSGDSTVPLKSVLYSLL